MIMIFLFSESGYILQTKILIKRESLKQEYKW